MAYVTCNPHYPEDIADVVTIYHDKHKFIGPKPYPLSNKYDLLGPKYEQRSAYGNARRLIMLVHSGTQAIADTTLILSAKYPRMTFLLAHSGMSYEAADRKIAVANQRANVYLEITYTTRTNGIIEYLTAKADANKVLFGSNMPMRDPAPQLAWGAYAKIPLEAKKKILGQNIQKLIARCYNKPLFSKTRGPNNGQE